MAKFLNVGESVAEMGKMDFQKIQSIEDEIANSEKAALAFVANPDKYMRKMLKGTFVPKSLHFHVRAKDAIFPPDTAIPKTQVVISTSITLNKKIKDKVLAEINKRYAKVKKKKPLYCEGCGECKFAVVN